MLLQILIVGAWYVDTCGEQPLYRDTVDWAEP